MKETIAQAARALLAGQTLLYPTDTVWGLGCDATNAAAVESLYRLKRRDPHKSMLILALPQWAPAQGPAATLLAQGPRPTTVVLPATLLPLPAPLAHNLPAADGTIGVRVPWGSPFCMQLLQTLGRPLVSTSANFAGQPTPPCRSAVDPALEAAVGLALPATLGELQGGTGSRIVRLNSDGSLTTIRP